MHELLPRQRIILDLTFFERFQREWCPTTQNSPKEIGLFEPMAGFRPQVLWKLHWLHLWITYSNNRIKTVQSSQCFVISQQFSVQSIVVSFWTISLIFWIRDSGIALQSFFLFSEVAMSVGGSCGSLQRLLRFPFPIFLLITKAGERSHPLAQGPVS